MEIPASRTGARRRRSRRIDRMRRILVPRPLAAPETPSRRRSSRASSMNPVWKESSQPPPPSMEYGHDPSRRAGRPGQRVSWSANAWKSSCGLACATRAKSRAASAERLTTRVRSPGVYEIAVPSPAGAKCISSRRKCAADRPMASVFPSANASPAPIKRQPTVAVTTVFGVPAAPRTNATARETDTPIRDRGAIPRPGE